MKVTPKDVAYVAELAHLDLTAEERATMESDLNSILDYIDRLNQLDTTNVPPMTQVSPMAPAGSLDGQEQSGLDSSLRPMLRPDDTSSSLSNEEALKNAPDGDRGYFRVPKVIER
jgi:aspartyl-tRNA(Asn)/glutamyl-tRNA(Gln) amidotransferase subunit C